MKDVTFPVFVFRFFCVFVFLILTFPTLHTNYINIHILRQRHTISTSYHFAVPNNVRLPTANKERGVCRSVFIPTSKLVYTKYRKRLAHRGSVHRHNLATLTRMTIAPEGSKSLQWLEQFENFENLPWNWSIPLIDQCEKEEDRNEQLHFWRDEWTYRDELSGSWPAGVIEGGQHNYDGMGLQLRTGADRQRLTQHEKIDDHGVRYRDNMKGADRIRFDLQPDGCQEMGYGVSDEEQDERQWGSWSRTGDGYLESAWPDAHVHDRETDLPYNWIQNAMEGPIVEAPVYDYSSEGIIPGPEITWEMAMRNLSQHEVYVSPEEKAQELLRLGKHPMQRQQIQFRNTLAKRRAAPRKSLEEVASIAFDTFVDEVLQYTDKMKKEYDTRDQDVNYMYSLIDNAQTFDYVGGGEWRCEDKNIDNKTICINFGGDDHRDNNFEVTSTTEEKAELAHIYHTEIQGQGWHHLSWGQTSDEIDKDYHKEFSEKRKQFDVFHYKYRPLWARWDFGEEFGDAMQPHERLNEASVLNFGEKTKHASDVIGPVKDANWLAEYNEFHN